MLNCRTKMKSLVRNILLICIASIVYYGCENPAPTELIQDQTAADAPVQVEIIAKDTADAYYRNGFDTTGVAGNLSRFGNVVTVSGIKNTASAGTEHYAFAQAIFFDKNSPVRAMNGRIIDYMTRRVGRISFNDVSAMQVPYTIAYRDSNTTTDTTLGVRYVLGGRQMGEYGNFNFRYGSNVKFSLMSMHGPQASFDIPTPPQITGTLKTSGSRTDGTLKVELDWNGGRPDVDIEVVIGAIVQGESEPLPLFRLKARDTGRLKIPPKLLNDLPHPRFGKLVFSLIRKIDQDVPFGNGGIHIISQSIHNIAVDLK